ncbi:MAG: hypothetical protein AAFY26_03510 [Cyanobacteria bacterium J06638_22]
MHVSWLTNRKNQSVCAEEIGDRPLYQITIATYSFKDHDLLQN